MNPHENFLEIHPNYRIMCVKSTAEGFPMQMKGEVQCVANSSRDVDRVESLLRQQAKKLRSTMDELAEYKRKERVQYSLNERRSISHNENFMRLFSSNRHGVIVMPKKHIERLWSTNLEFYNRPEGSFFCNAVYAKTIGYSLSEVTHPDFSHRNIGLWYYAEKIRKLSKTFQNALWCLYSGVRRVDYKCVLVDRNGVKIPMDAQFHTGDEFCFTAFIPAREVTFSFSFEDEGKTFTHEGVKLDKELDGEKMEKLAVDMALTATQLKKSVSPSEEQDSRSKEKKTDPLEEFDQLFSKQQEI